MECIWQTLFCVDETNTCTPDTLYEGPFSIPEGSDSFLRFASEDLAGNLEDVKGVSFTGSANDGGWFEEEEGNMKNNFGFGVMSSGFADCTGEVQYNDRHDTFRFHDVADACSFSDHDDSNVGDTINIFGEGKLRTPGMVDKCSFIITATDKGEPGKENDIFGIEILDCYEGNLNEIFDESGGTIGQGNIKVEIDG